MKMNKKTKKKEINKSFDFILLIVVLLLLGLGIIMVLSASSPSSLATNGSSYTYVKKQAIAAIIGIIAMLIISTIDYKKYQKYSKIMYLFSVIILLLVLVPGIGKTVNGARRWIRVPIFNSVQPSEITKLGLIIFFASYLSKNRNELKSLWNGFFKPILLFAAPPLFVILVIQSHLSASVIIVIVISIMMIVAGCRIRYFLSIGGIGATLRFKWNVCCRKVFKYGKFQVAEDNIISESVGRSTRYRLANNTKLICNWFWRIIWGWTSEIVDKNIYISQNRIMILYLQF